MDGVFGVEMDPSIVAEGWERLHDRYYRKTELYKMQWGEKVKLERSQVIGASCGGALAVRRNHSIIQDASLFMGSAQIEIYTSSGQLISSFPEPQEVAKMGWDDAERLVIIQRNGMVLLLDVFGQVVNRIDRQELREGVFGAHIWGVGAVILTNSMQFYTLMNFEDPLLVKLKDPQLQAPPTSWTVIEPSVTSRDASSAGVQVLVATQTGTILLVTGKESFDARLRNGPFTSMSVDPTGKILACYTSTGNIWVVQTDLMRNLSTFEIGRTTPPKQLEWCGVDSVCCYWEDATTNLILLVGPANTSLKFNYDSPVHLVGEPDGVRVISDNRCELLQRVPDGAEAVRRLNGHAAILCEAYDEYEKPSPRCDELLRTLQLQDRLRPAVDTVLSAASFEFDLLRQQRCLKAASLGKTFCDVFPPHEFVRTCKTLRVLNQVRDARFGIPLTYTQFGILTPQLLVERLLGRRLHALAYSICDYLGLNSDPVLVHWACTKVRLSAREPETEEGNRLLVHQITDRLACNPVISYSDIARTALAIKRPRLATLLLDYEPSPRDQVPLLLDMHQEELAMQKAVMSGDTDLVFIVILRLKKILTPTEFLGFLSKHEIAMSLYIKYCKEEDPHALSDVYKFHNRLDQQAYIQVRMACNAVDFQARRDAMRLALDMYKQSPNAQAMHKATDEEISLLLLQQGLEAKTKSQFVGSSLSSTIYRTILLGDDSAASKMAKNFGVPDKRFWWLKIRALSELGAWEALEKFSKDKSSPIGYEPFAEVSHLHGNLVEAIKYAKRIKTPESKVKWLSRLGQWSDAFMAARDAKSVELIQLVRRDCPDPRVNGLIDEQLRNM
jgi:hypothetical protein